MTVTRVPISRDLLDFDFLDEVAVSPDGRLVAWVVRTIDEVENEYRSSIWVGPFADGPGRTFTAGPGQDHSPVWSPDGRWLAFLSDRTSRTEAGVAEIKRLREEDPAFPERVFQIWRLPLEGGEARQVTFMERSAGRPVWASDGRRLVFAAGFASSDRLDTRSDAATAAPTPPAAPPPTQPTVPGLDALYAKHNRDVRVITRIAYKLDGVGFFDERRIHLFALALGEGGRPSGPPTRLTTGDYNHADPVFSPDGSRLAFTGIRVPDPHQADLEPWDRLYVMPAQGGEPREVAGARGPCFLPAWSPDGGRLAFVGHERPHGWYSTERLWLVEVGDESRSAPVCRTAGVELHLGDQSLTDMREHGSPPRPAWTPDGRHLVFLASCRGETQLYRIRADGTTPPVPLTQGDRIIYGCSLSADARRAALAITSPQAPGDVYTLDLGPENLDTGDAAAGPLPETRLTSLNARLLSEMELAPTSRFNFVSDGLTMDAWIMTPPKAAGAQGQYPAVVEVHGGPMGMYSSAFFFEFQLLAAAGYAVVYGNPRGSTSYGEDFCRAIRGTWGDLDYKDVMAMTDEALRRFPFIDPARLGIAGGSYGGFMANWVIGHTDRFAAAVTMRSVVSFTSDFGCSDIGYLDDEDFGGPPWDCPDLYRRLSPLAYVTSMKTPVLILHSEEDHRCPVQQAEELYVSLKKLGRTVEFVRFPGESHGLSRGGKPWHRVFRLDQILRWFARYLPGGPDGR